MKNRFNGIRNITTGLGIILVLLSTGCADKQGTETQPKVSVAELEEGFTTPPDSVKPSVYWYWISNNISKEGVRKDLEAMAREGIGRAFIGNIGLDKQRSTYGEVDLLSDEWLEITQLAIRKASEEGIDIGLFNSPGWSQSGGPWNGPEQSMKYMANLELQVEGPQNISQKLKRPEGYFEDVALLAFPKPDYDQRTIADTNPSVTTNLGLANSQALVDGDTTSTTLFTGETGQNGTIEINIKTPEPFKARSLVLHPAHQTFRANAILRAKTDNGYQKLKEFTLNRSNDRKTVGFKPFGPVSVSFPETEAKEFQLTLTNIRGQSGLAEIGLSPAPHIEYYIEKQLAKMHQTPLPLWGSYQWEQQSEVDGQGLTISPESVLNISENLSEDGSLYWDVPEGEWVVLRLGMQTTGVTNHPAAPSGTGLEVDKLNKTPLKGHFNAFVGKVLNSMPEEDRKAFKYVVADSYETGSQNWTHGLAEDFEQEFGYDPLPWLPVLTGRVVGSVDQSTRFLWDLRRLVADRVAYEYVGGLSELSNQHGLKMWLENYGHWGFPAEFLQYGGQADEIAGEFWAEGDLGSIELRAASSAAHIYGKNKVAAESFTANLITRSQPFGLHPGNIKKRGDWSFTEGVNHTLLHVYIMQAYEDRNPGVNAWFGTEFNRKNTWFDHMDLFTDYLRRSMLMLQQGKPVADVAYFIGEGAPKMTGIQEPELPSGYSFDYINAEVIKERLSVENGKMVLADGVSYDLLVLPDLDTMRPELLEKIKNLVEGGANILGPKPTRSPSLQNYPEADRQVQQMAAELWENIDGTSVKKGTYGSGKVMWGLDMSQALEEVNVQPDFEVSGDGPVLYTHRRMGDTEIYFVTNQSGQKISITPTFRVEGKQPEFWDPVTGHQRDLPVFSTEGNRTQVPLTLEAYQSGFLVFEESVSTSPGSTDRANFTEPVTVSNIEGPWEVTFDSTRKGPEQPVTFNQLIDWKDHQNDLIKYYSGSAEYQTTFDASAPGENENIYLDLGSVEVMAKVWINGQYVGGAWTAPRRVDITSVLKDGENELKIEVVNTWINRLIGDSKLPENQRTTWAMMNDFTPQDELVPSGLLGPVRLLEISY